MTSHVVPQQQPEEHEELDDLQHKHTTTDEQEFRR